MKAGHSDPDGQLEKTVKALQQSLRHEAQRLLEQDQPEQALVTLFRAYALKPGVTPVLHSIAEVYQHMGDLEAATACRRGVIPETAEKQFFAASTYEKSIRQARKASNSRHIVTSRSENVSLNTPSSNGHPVSRPEFRAVKTESRGSFVTIATQGKFWFDGFNTVVMDSKDNILREHIKGNPYVIADTARLRPERHLQGTVCFLDARSSPIYYHWMVDVLPKFAILQQAGIDLKSIDYFVVRCRSAYQQETLRQLGVPLDRVIDCWSEGMTKGDKLIVPFLKHDRGDRFYNGLGLGMGRWVTQWLPSVFSISTNRQHRRLYLSRAIRGTRCVTDEDELIQALEQRGFECITLESMSVSEQAMLMASAQIVVAPHGAGLTNIVFSQPGTTIIEIFGNYVVPCYWALSELAELSYHAYFVDNQNELMTSPEQAHAKAASLNERRDQNIKLDVTALLAYIDPLLAQTSLASAS